MQENPAAKRVNVPKSLLLPGVDLDNLVSRWVATKLRCQNKVNPVQDRVVEKILHK